MIVKALFLILILFNFNLTQAGPLLEGINFSVVENTNTTPHMFPNERSPEKFIELLSGQITPPPGVLLSVGFERSFISAATLPNITGLIVLDINNQIVSVSELNAKILDLFADSPEMYSSFRSGKVQYDIDSLLASLSGVGYLDLVTFLSFSKILWENNFGPERGFSDSVKYWTHPQLLKKLMNMSRTGRIVARQVDLMDPTGRLQKIISSLKDKKEKISFVDLSNVMDWVYKKYGKSQGTTIFRDFARALSPVLYKDSVLLFTHLNLLRPWKLQNPLDNFEYKTASFKQLRSLSRDQLFDLFSPEGVMAMTCADIF